jgi:hypothetical protein
MPRRTTKIKGGLLEHVLKGKNPEEIKIIIDNYKSTNNFFDYKTYNKGTEELGDIPFFAYVDKNGYMFMSKKEDDKKPNTTATLSTYHNKSDLDLIPVTGPISNILRKNGMTEEQLDADRKEIERIIRKHKKSTLKPGGALQKYCLKRLRKGGGIIDESKNMDFLRQLTAYCANEDDENDLKLYYEKIMKIKNHDNIIIESKENGKYKFNLLIDYISNIRNLISVTKRLYINCNNFYRYEDCMPYYDPKKVFIKDINCFKYNEDIITAFEDLLVGDDVDYSEGVLNDIQIFQNFTNEIYSNNRAINLFLKEQLEFLKNLPLYRKRILQDYTRINTTFHFYDLYRYGKMKEFKEFRYFSDGFYTQIYKLYNDAYSKELNFIYWNILYPDNVDNNSKTGDAWYEDWLKSERVPDKKEQYGVEPTEYKHATTTIFYVADFIDWELVLSTFLADVSLIILEAPIVKETIHGFRGVSTHYVRESEVDAKRNKYISIIKKTLTESADSTSLNSLEYFTSNKTSSMTFNFDVSNSFYNKYRGDKSAIYKTSIKKGCRALLIAPLSMFFHEFEILTPQYTTIAYIPESVDKTISEITTNNIKKQYGICTKQEFKTYSHIITKTPQTFEEFALQPAIYEKKQLAQKQKEEKYKKMEARGSEIADELIAKIKKIVANNMKSEEILKGKQITRIINDDTLINIYNKEYIRENPSSPEIRRLGDDQLIQLAAHSETQNLISKNEQENNLLTAIGAIFDRFMNKTQVPEISEAAAKELTELQSQSQPGYYIDGIHFDDITFESSSTKKPDTIMIFIDDQFKLVERATVTF